MTLTTRWGADLDPDSVLQDYPRPQLVRDSYLNLNGYWQYAITSARREQPPADGEWDGEILVPFSPEAPLSGVNRQLQPQQFLWYRRTLRLPAGFAGERVLLHFGAMDQSCTVTVNGIDVGGHDGGYLPFSLDITDALAAGSGDADGSMDSGGNVDSGGTGDTGHSGDSGDSAHELVVRVRDISDTGYASRGKQTLDRGGIWYTAQSGIWQTVWLESVPRTSISQLVLVPDLESVSVTVLLDGGGTGSAGTGASASASAGASSAASASASAGASSSGHGDLRAAITVSSGGRTVADAVVVPGKPVRIPVPDPHLWTPEDPFLYDVSVRLLAGDGGAEIDSVRSYTGLRTFGTGPDAAGHTRLLLNGRPYFHAGLLDQGYWPDGLYTAPSDEALAYDIEAAKDLGFTMLRKHIKIEPLRWYYHCDRLGMLVWQDLVNGGRSYRHAVVTAPAVGMPHRDDGDYAAFGRADEQGRAEFRAELRGTVDLLRNCTSIAVWVPFNEGWGQFDANAATQLLRGLDPTRSIDHASGWHDQGGGDLKSIHVYFVPFRLRKGWLRDGRAVVLSEYGGYSLRVPGHTFNDKEFGYRRFKTRDALRKAYAKLHRKQIEPAVEEGLAATVYTQLTDVEDEVNGLLTYDRRVVKIDAGTVRGLNARLIRAAGAAGAGRG
ncbi:glycoside hydrolase family 2 [Arthrobacter sp. zg-Y1219]|uniref:glycoside hydrolase family 2 protein n=1 Tax=Arthrobacter sp. zg-Y1219 TaxID=3049067 RepID=UPI0024C3914D|nr:sugar-binding domain-containing protein [Arthrobacter sp. zg-Y1219]MDK1360272.1 glycoside hydrolase family 2 [Arthrobacter sp. zg-Y1219]